MILGWWDIPLIVAAIYVVGVKVWAKAQERPSVKNAKSFRALAGSLGEAVECGMRDPRFNTRRRR